MHVNAVWNVYGRECIVIVRVSGPGLVIDAVSACVCVMCVCVCAVA